MILEAVRILSDWFAHPTYGINAQLATVARDAGDPVPPSVALITDETRNYQVAIRQLPTVRPCVTVFLAFDLDIDPETLASVRNGDVSLIISYGNDKNETADGIRDGYYTLRAVVASLRDLNSNAGASARTRNGIMLLRMTELTYQTPFMTTEDSTVVNSLKVTFVVRDTQP